MSSMFSLPLPIYQQPVSKSNSRELKSKKRKRRGATDPNSEPQDVPNEEEFLSLSQLQASSQSLEYSAVLTPEERTQYRVAGQPFDQEVPPFPFPHSATQTDKAWSSQSTINLTRPPPAPTLHLQHLSVITAILHRCLAEQDYARASRAFGLIMRDSVGGHRLDVRNEGRWGIGAEILLKAGTQHDRSLGLDARDPKPSQPAPIFTREGFERAKRYYERLIIQYPFHKTHPAAVNALDFYPALFGLWIYVVHEEGKTAATLSPDLSHQDDHVGELQQAREIAGRMDACMSSVPFSDDLELIRLRGMVALWVADLAESRSGHHSNTKEADAMGTETIPVDGIVSDESVTALQDGSKGQQEEQLRLEARQSRHLAQQMFARLEDFGRPLRKMDST